MNRNGITGATAVFTGAWTPLAITVARRLGNEGAWLAFVGRRASDHPGLLPLIRQFRRRAVCIDREMTDPESASRILREIEELLGPVRLIIHTLGAASSDALTWGENRAPLRAALACTGAAARCFPDRSDLHVLHLVSEAQIGAAEVEQIALSRLARSWRSSSPPALSVSAIYLDEAAAEALRPSGRTEPRILEAFTGRLAAEDDWAERFAMEQRIGDLVVRLCGRTEPEAGKLRSFALKSAGQLRPDH